MNPKFTAVLSSNIAGYYALKNGNLMIAYLSGDTYLYEGIPKSVVDGLAVADSKGSYVNANIKAPGYSYRKIDETEIKEFLNGEPDQMVKRAKLSAERRAILNEFLKRYPALDFVF